MAASASNLLMSSRYISPLRSLYNPFHSIIKLDKDRNIISAHSPLTKMAGVPLTPFICINLKEPFQTNMLTICPLKKDLRARVDILCRAWSEELYRAGESFVIHILDVQRGEK